MPRARRDDEPGALHHVMSRGIARRPVFESREDARHFLARLAREVRRGELEVHAYSVMTTHYHALVRSRRGALSGAMERVLHHYVRRFNRQRKRDGSLFRGRFLSRRVAGRAYRRLLYRYIDDNAVAARVVDDASCYPYGSAQAYARMEGPRWLHRDWAEQEAVAAAGADRYAPELYRRHFPTRLSDGAREFVERRLRHRAPDADELESLVGAAVGEVREWMERKARLADGTRPGLPLVPAASVVDLVAAEMLSPTCFFPSRRTSATPTDLMAAGLLRSICGLSIREVSLALNVTESTARRRIGDHHRALLHVPRYSARVATIVTTALHRLVE